MAELENTINAGTFNDAISLFKVVTTKGTKAEVITTPVLADVVFGAVTESAQEEKDVDNNILMVEKIEIITYKHSELNNRWLLSYKNTMYEILSIVKIKTDYIKITAIKKMDK